MQYFFAPVQKAAMASRFLAVLFAISLFAPTAQALTWEEVYLSQSQTLGVTNPSLTFTSLGCNANNRCNYRISYTVPSGITNGLVKIGRSVRQRNISSSGYFDTGYILKKQYLYYVSFWSDGRRLAREGLKAMGESTATTGNSGNTTGTSNTSQNSTISPTPTPTPSTPQIKYQTTQGTVSSPAAGASLKFRSQQTIRWSLPGAAKINLWLVPATFASLDQPLDFEYISSNAAYGSVYPIVWGLDNTGSYDWTVDSPSDLSFQIRLGSVIPPLRNDNAELNAQTAGCHNCFRIYVEGVKDAQTLNAWKGYWQQHATTQYWSQASSTWAVSGRWGVARDTAIPADEFGNLVAPDKFVTFKTFEKLPNTASGLKQYKITWDVGAGLKTVSVEVCTYTAQRNTGCFWLPTDGNTLKQTTIDAQAKSFTFTLDPNTIVGKEIYTYNNGNVFFRFRSTEAALQPPYTSDYVSLPSAVMTLQ